MNYHEEQNIEDARYKAHQFGSVPHGLPFTIRRPEVGDALALKAVMDENFPEARYAAYYYAMNFIFLRDTSFVVDDEHDHVVGGIVGLYDFEFKKLIVSHIAASLSLAAEHAAAVKVDLVERALENAAKRGVQEITAHLDTPHDPVIDEAIKAAAETHGLSSYIVFNNAAHQMPQAIQHESSKIDVAEIVYRHPVESDAHALWSLVLKINKESGGLDIYALSNYQRLCRDLSETCMLAEHQGNIVGFATGFMMPNQPEKGLFLWQTGVDPDYHGKGIGSKVETLLIDRHRPGYLNFTVEASNGAANRTAEKKAEYMRTGFAKTGDISSDVLGGGHEPEVIYYVGEAKPRIILW